MAEIPFEQLKTHLEENTSETVLENEIIGIHIEHVTLKAGKDIPDHATNGYKTIYLFIKGAGTGHTSNANYELIPETILLPNNEKSITIKADQNQSLHYLKISSKLTEQDLLDLKEFPAANTQKVYFSKFSDCRAYTEPIKSPNTISRTILPNKIIPRIAMGTVQTKGPDEVGAHKHPMLEQLFLGLSENQCTVYADEVKAELYEFTLLHIPLGSSHSVSVEKDKTLYYVWMDFFLDSKGEEWLKTHIEDEE